MFKNFYNTAMHNMMTFGRRSVKRRERCLQHSISGAFDTEAREAVIVQQAQIEALQRGMQVVHEYLSGPAFNGTGAAKFLEVALEIQDPMFGDEPESDDEVEDSPEVSDGDLLHELRSREMIAVNSKALLALLLKVSNGAFSPSQLQSRIEEIRFGEKL